jgi:hypothetical protein
MNTRSCLLPLMALPGFLLAAGCGTGVPPDQSGEVVARTAAVNRLVAYIPKATYWNVSAIGGDRGANWHQTLGDFTSWEWFRAPMGYGETYVNEIPFGPDASNKPTTVYFRSTFYVPDLSHLHSLWLHMMYDDGFVAYINGHEVTRAHMPTGPVAYGTFATGHESNNSYESFDLGAARAFLLNGTNSISIEVHQVSPSSSDLVFDASIDGEAWFDAPPPPYGSTTPHDQWSFWDKGGDLGTAWRQGNFDASAWDFGFAPLGYGETKIVTPLSFGPNPASKYITTYFRQQLIVDQPASVAGIDGYASFDDGFVIYLNGQRIGGDSMPPGEITASTLALPHESTTDYQAYSWPATGLVQGVNTLAVEVHQADPSSSDLVFEMNVGVRTVLPPPALPATISRGSAWKYFDQGVDPGAIWREPGYDDAAWPAGAGPLGYGESYLHTVTSSGSDPAHKPITTYFRRRFAVDVPTGFAITGAVGELMFDDGAVVHLNGHEVQRAFMPGGEITATTRADDHEAAADTYARFDWTSAKDFLIAGENIIAVEIHQTGSASSDLVFDLALDVQTAPQFTKHSPSPMFDPSTVSDDYSWQRYVSGPNVMRGADENWVMFFTGTDGGPHDMIGRAVSADGLVWARDLDPVDSYGTRAAVVYDGTRYHMWAPQVRQAGLWYSSSSDGRLFTRRAREVIGASHQASVVKDGDVFRLWHRLSTGLSYAVSTDGVNWTHHPSLVFDPVNAFTVIKDGGEYKMWFAETAGLIYATSADGIHWRRRGISLAAGAPGLHGEWDAQMGRASVVRDEGILKMWYAASGVVNESSTNGIGYATVP